MVHKSYRIRRVLKDLNIINLKYVCNNLMKVSNKDIIKHQPNQIYSKRIKHDSLFGVYITTPFSTYIRLLVLNFFLHHQISLINEPKLTKDFDMQIKNVYKTRCNILFLLYTYPLIFPFSIYIVFNSFVSLFIIVTHSN